jgi:Zn-dependent protease with chaperone function
MVNASYFDGMTATAHVVSLVPEGQDMVLRGAEFELRWPLHQVHISERLGNTPRLLTYSGGGHCEVNDHAALETMLAQLGMKSSWLDGMQHSLAWAFFAAVLIVLTLLASYRYLLPFGAEVVARRVPGAVLQKMGSSTLDTFDRFLLKPSKLDATRRQQLSDEYAKLKPPAATNLQYHILFRSSPDMGANAFALPDGSIVMLDELVALTRNDKEILAVLAHERGHVEQRHALRMVLQSSVVGLVLTWYVGDVSTILASAPAIIMQAKYSRDMEREADQYAERTLLANGLSPCLLADILQKLESAHRPKPGEKTDVAEGSQEDKALDYLSSHPATTERAALLCPSK